MSDADQADDRELRFDTDTAWRVMTEVQRFGLEAASTVVTRFAGLAADQVDPSPSGRDRTPAGIPVGRWMEELATGLAALGSTLDDLPNGAPASTDPDRQPLQARSADNDGARHGPEAALNLTGRPGTRLRFSIWIHNLDTESLSPGTTRVGPLVSADGSILPGSAAVSADDLDQVEPGGSIQVDLELDIAIDTGPGHYHGVILASGSDCPRPLPLTVTVGDSEAAP